MVEPILALIQVQVEGPIGDSVELLQSSLSEVPEALDAVDVMRATHELVFAMKNSEVFGVSNMNQAIVATPSIQVDNCLGSHATANNGLLVGDHANGANHSVQLPRDAFPQ
jgi:hypothetical protein